MNPTTGSDVETEQIRKRKKITKESTIEDIASSIRDIGESVGSITNSYRTLLKVNKAVVVYCLEAQKRHKKLNIDGIVADLEQSNIAES